LPAGSPCTTNPECCSGNCGASMMCKMA
jgi:hypothetical protein